MLTLAPILSDSKYYKLNFPFKIVDVALTTDDDGVVLANKHTVLTIMRQNNGWYAPGGSVQLEMGTIQCLTYCQDRRIILVGMSCNYIYTVNLSTEQITTTHSYLYERAKKIVYSSPEKWFAAFCPDKEISWFSFDCEQPMCSFKPEFTTTVIDYDPVSHNVLVGGINGNAMVLSVDNRKCRVLHHLNCPDDLDVFGLALDNSNSHLLCLLLRGIIYAMELNSRKQVAYVLKGHDWSFDPVFEYIPGGKSFEINGNSSGLIISGAEDKKIIAWFMDTPRIPPPARLNSPNCHICKAKLVKFIGRGKLRDYCRACGNDVCKSCSKTRSTIPTMGYEKKTRVCDGCSPRIKTQRSLAKITEVDGPVTCLRINHEKKRLLTIEDKTCLKIWDIPSMLADT